MQGRFTGTFVGEEPLCPCTGVYDGVKDLGDRPFFGFDDDDDEGFDLGDQTIFVTDISVDETDGKKPGPSSKSGKSGKSTKSGKSGKSGKSDRSRRAGGNAAAVSVKQFKAFKIDVTAVGLFVGVLGFVALVATKLQTSPSLATAAEIATHIV